MTDQTQLSASFAGFAGDVFRNRGRHGVLIGASITYVIVTVLATAGLIAMAIGALGEYAPWAMSMAQRGPDGPMEMPPSSVMSLIPILFLYVVVSFLVFAAYEAGCLRWLVRGETSGLLGLTFGADMWRVWLCYWMWLVVGLGLYIGCAAPIGLVMAIVGVATQNELLTIGFAIAVGAVVGCLAIWLCVRLAPATATTVALKRFAFFDAWKVTKGRFWVLFAAYVVLWVAYIVASQVIQTVGVMALMGPLLSMIATTGGTPDPESFSAALMTALASPAIWIGVAVLVVGILVIGMMFYVALFAVSARAALVAKQEGRI
jgi:hypothetical protein